MSKIWRLDMYSNNDIDIIRENRKNQGMVECAECGAFFFLKESLERHNSYCIGKRINNML